MIGSRKLKEMLYDGLWSLGVRARDVGKRLGVSGPIEPWLMYLAPLLIPPPALETEITLRTGETLWIPGNFPSQRNYSLGLYERDLCNLLPSLIQSGMSVLDVGANVGFYTVVMARLVGEHGKVFAFEPDNVAFSYLERNIAKNGCKNVIAVKLAVVDKPRTVSFVAESIERGFVCSGGGSDDSSSIPAVSLDAYFESLGWPQIDFMKLDIEGGETDALAGMDELSRKNRNLRVVIEYNWRAIQRAGRTPDELSARLRSLGFTQGRMIERNLDEFAIDRSLPRTGAMYNLLLTKD
jgi:FkbM family methyltransferase